MTGPPEVPTHPRGLPAITHIAADLAPVRSTTVPVAVHVWISKRDERILIHIHIHICLYVRETMRRLLTGESNMWSVLNAASTICLIASPAKADRPNDLETFPVQLHMSLVTL